ncbi:hypothetical protein M8J76_011800, partial [Diaphorina citri]
ELKTEDKLEYQFFPLPGPTLKFQVKANNDAHIAFTQALGEGEPMYEVFIGGWNNSKSAIRKNKQKPDVATVETPGILTEAGHKGFWITVRGGTVSVGYDGESSSFLSYQDPEPFPVHYYGVCTGWGATGEWFIEGMNSVAKCNTRKYRTHFNYYRTLELSYGELKGGGIIVRYQVFDSSTGLCL